MLNVFNSKFALEETPQQSWLFKVQFFSSYGDLTFVDESNSEIPELTPLKIDLPKFEYKTFTQKYLGTEKTFPVGLSKSGESTMEFLLNEKDTLYRYLGMVRNNGPKALDPIRQDTTIHFSKIVIKSYDQTGLERNNYELYNPIITNLEHTGSFDYAGEEAIRISLTIHYDDWDVR